MKHLLNIAGLTLICIGGNSLGIVDSLLVMAGAFILFLYGVL